MKSKLLVWIRSTLSAITARTRRSYPSPFAKAEVLRKPQKATQRKNDLGREPQSLRLANRFPWFQKNSRLPGESVNKERLTLE